MNDELIVKELTWDAINIHCPIDYTGRRVRVTDRNNQIYVYDGFAWKPEITWTNCADEMPPDGHPVILKYGDKAPQLRLNGRLPYDEYLIVKNRICYWTPYTDEKWKEINE